MKRIVAVGIIATLIILAMVGVASAYGVTVVNVTVDGSNPANTTVEFTTSTCFHVIFNVTSGIFPNNVKKFVDTRLNIRVNNISKTYGPDPLQLRNKVTNKTYSIPSPQKEEIESGEYEVIFEPVTFLNFGIKAAGIKDVNYTINFSYMLGSHTKPVNKTSKPAFGPAVGPTKPQIIKKVPLKKDIYYNDDLEIVFDVKDVWDMGTAILIAYKPPHYNETQFISPPEEVLLLGSDIYRYIWNIIPEDHKFTKDHVNITKKTPFKLCVDYDSYYDYPNWSCGWLRVTEDIPKIVAYLGPYSREEKRKELSEEDWNKIYVEKDDLQDKFRFNATIEDEKGKGTAILEVCRMNDSLGCDNYSLAGPSDGSKHQYSNESIRFHEGNFSLRLYYNRSNLPPWWPCPSKPWKVYNITITPFSINFTNGIVNPPSGSCNDRFNYSVDVKNASEDFSITLRVFDPYREPEPWVWRGAPDIKETPTFKWTDRKPCENYCAGQSKFYFEYRIGDGDYQGESQVFFGPELSKPPPEFDNDSVDPNVTIYCNWSQRSTPCNYSVDVNSEDDYTVRLLVKDPDTGEWVPKGDKEISSTTNNITTWPDIKPFQSLNIDNITQYIDNETRANFTFEYNGQSYKDEYRGPLLVAAFKEPKIELMTGDGEINYNDTFNYSINVYGSKRLNITLMYRENPNEEWITEGIDGIDGIDVSTRQYNNTFNWTSPPMIWRCRAIKSWAEVKMEVEVEGEKKPIKVY